MSSPPVTTQVAGRTLQLTNLDKVLFPDQTTKAELIQYYLAIAPVMLPHLAERCITRLRFPNGTDAQSFYEKNAPKGTPDWVRTAIVATQDSPVDYVVADNAATLVWLANLAAVELHTPQWRTTDAPATPGHPAGSPGHPIALEGPAAVPATTLVVDLDPGPGITMHDSCRAAMLAATELATAGLEPFVKTSGSKGLQLMARIEPAPWREVVEQVRRLGAVLAHRHPDLFTTTMAKDARGGKIYWDHLQNRGDRNTISVYSVRGRDQPRVSTPITWDEVAAIGPDDPLSFTIDEVLDRVGRHGDLWRPLLDDSVSVPLPSWPEEPTA
ncbi:non-homologous end-joining DNA ligase [Propionibacteriaceae bacterium G57]|uniref:non-homologous end-joining DNA ligase n=1 Tax=Aestuariimicrobium sp. G57 TaxID=3418485 RepID=UPI003DA6E9AD